MIIYRNTAGGFIQDVRDNLIAEKIENAFLMHCINHNNNAEYRSWANSMQYMRNVLEDASIPSDCRIAIEYQIPVSSKRIDFLIAGEDETANQNVVVIELKQWEYSEPTERVDVVRTFTGGANRDVTHPCYQAYSYAKIIEDFVDTVSEANIHLYPCAYLHNYKEENRKYIDNDFYREAINLAPIFLSRDAIRLRQFIGKYIHRKSDKDLLMVIENGKLRPSKSLQDTLTSLLKGNREFCLIDEQKVAYETVRKAVEFVLKKQEQTPSAPIKKYTFIVQGGPGTGKSVIAIQLLAELINRNYSALYVTKNSAPRNVYFAKLRQDNYKQNYIKRLFTGSGSFVDVAPNTFDCLLADEAHRLQMKSGRFQNKGEAQVREIIRAAKVSVFFIDEDQKVTTSDIGSVAMIRQYAQMEGSQVVEGDSYNLVSQFRCNGSDGYLSFLNNLLGMKQTPNVVFDMDYDIRIFDDPNEMRDELRIKNMVNNRSRMLAGYCYNWISKDSKSGYDICLRNGFKAQWNFGDTTTWAIDPVSFDQVGCIHTSQGLEFDYVGVIIGQDMRYENGNVITDYTKRARTDKSLVGFRQRGGEVLADTIIRNTYKTLMSRGQKGCYIYCEDEALAAYMKQLLSLSKPSISTIPTAVSALQSAILENVPEEEKYLLYYPVYSVRAACGRFGAFEPVEALGWMKVDGMRTKERTRFIVQAVGHSMEPRIQDGDYCLFQANPAGSRQGKIVLAEQIGEVDEDYQGSHTIKEYHSTKRYDEFGNWEHESITLKPLNKAYPDIIIDPDDAEYLRIIGEFIRTI